MCFPRDVSWLRTYNLAAHDCPIFVTELFFSEPRWYYVLQCVLATILLRMIFFAFRAAAVVRGDFPGSDPEGERPREPGREWSYWRAFWECFYGFGHSRAHADLWLNAFIGFWELAAYPILLKTGRFEIIGGWLLLKTAGAWGGWKVSRTSFNRFLLNNLLELAIALLLADPVRPNPKINGAALLIFVRR